jgi:hypothetical protein
LDLFKYSIHQWQKRSYCICMTDLHRARLLSIHFFIA